VLKHKKQLITIITLFFSHLFFAQKGILKINQASKLDSLIMLKKEVNKEAFTSDQYTIQIFSGNYNDGSELFEKLKEKKIEQLFFSFETPYYKIRIGKYISKIDAIKKLGEIKKDFPSAFILKPN
tara:strand:- start:1395 stop:1769 length:375 start_codon:yes stop_codon:yes gene_type:complete